MARPSLDVRKAAADAAKASQQPSGLGAAVVQQTDDPKSDEPIQNASPRPAMRPDQRSAPRAATREDMRAADPLAAAEQRATELMEHLGDLDEGTDEFYIDRDIIPPGWDYQWKVVTVLGQSNPAYDVSVRRAGWEAVPAARHPEMMPLKNKTSAIERKGMILMERPKSISKRASEIELQRARAQVRMKEDQLNAAPPGHFEREHPKLANRVTHDYAPIEIPE